MDGLSGLSSASIDTFDLIPNVSIIVLLGKLGRRAVRRASGLGSQFVLLLSWPIVGESAYFNV
jgi:hypothetical protein